MSDLSFPQQINSLAARTGSECKALHTKIGNLTSLGTSDKTSVVSAINEVRAAASTLQTTLNEFGSRLTQAENDSSSNESAITQIQLSISALTENLGSVQTALGNLEDQVTESTNIDDSNPSQTTTYSSVKVDSLLTEAKQAVKDDLLGGAGTAYDTLKELADLITTNGDAIEALEALAAGHVRFDSSQALSGVQQQQARSNINAASATDLTSVRSTANSANTKATQAATDIASLESAVGDTTTDFVAAFEAALEAE